MASLGYRGRVEIRDSGVPVDLTDDTCASWQLFLGLAQPPLSVATDIAATTSLASLEMTFEELYQINEIDYDRKKVASMTKDPSAGRADATDFLRGASERGSQWVTRRRFREATGTVPNVFARDLLIPTGSYGHVTS
jgi:hypothetical protein